MAEPQLATLREMQDGTYSIEDVMRMNILLREKARRIEEATKK